MLLILLLIKFWPIKFGLKLFNELSGDSSILLVKKKSLAKSSILVKFGSLSPISCKAIILLTSSVSVVWLVIQISILVISIGEFTYG